MLVEAGFWLPFSDQTREVHPPARTARDLAKLDEITVKSVMLINEGIFDSRAERLAILYEQPSEDDPTRKDPSSFREEDLRVLSKRLAVAWLADPSKREWAEAYTGSTEPVDVVNCLVLLALAALHLGVEANVEVEQTRPPSSVKEHVVNDREAYMRLWSFTPDEWHAMAEAWKQVAPPWERLGDQPP
jgi:hypothetical protein